MDQIYSRPDKTKDSFDPDPELSYTLPAPMYYDPTTLEEEKRKIFHRTWNRLGHASDVVEPGSYITGEIAGQFVAAVRGRGGELRAFFNVCQHRGHLLLQGKGKLKNVITCPYHAWAYDYGGQLVAAPDCEHVKGFDKKDFTIPAVRVEEFFGFVFVTLDPNARSMDETYPGMRAALEKNFPAVEPLSLKEHREIIFDIKGNWKNVGDNALECYHCSPAHKAFVDLVDMETYKVECFENWSIQYGNCHPQNSAYDYEDGATCNHQFLVIFLFPSLFFTQFAGTDGIAMFSFLPLEPELTHLSLKYYGPESEMTAGEKAAMDYFNDVLGPEDVGLVETVQKGLHSLGYHQGRFIIDTARGATQEHAVHHFHSMIADALDG